MSQNDIWHTQNLYNEEVIRALMDMAKLLQELSSRVIALEEKQCNCGKGE